MGNDSRINSSYAVTHRRAARSLLPLPTFSTERMTSIRNSVRVDGIGDEMSDVRACVSDLGLG